MNNIIEKLQSRNSIKNILGLLAGISGGYLYYHFIGCSSGSCAITSNPWMSMLWGGILGYLLFDMFKLKSRSVTSKNEPTAE